MRTLKTSEAAAVLGVSPDTLRAWERRFGYPLPRRSPGRHRLYTYEEIATLREELGRGLSISSAISAAREGCVADAHAVLTALTEFRADRADEVMERALAVRPLERSVEIVLLPALDSVHERHGGRSATWAFAVGWAAEWLVRARRMAPAGPRRGAVLVGDAAAPPLAPTIPSVRALELCCVRSGLALLCLPVSASEGIDEAVSAFTPDVVVIAGSCASDAEVSRWAYRVRLAAGPVPFVIYQRALNPLNGSSARVLPPSPLAAHARLQALLPA